MFSCTVPDDSVPAKRPIPSQNVTHRVRMLVKPMDQRINPNSSPTNLAVSNFYQNWNDATLITANDNWSVVPSVVGYLGDDTFGEGVDPQLIVTPYSTVNVMANQGSNTALATGGIAEFDGLDAVALKPDSNADAPNLVVSFNTVGRSNIVVSYNLRDLDASAADSIQPVALQYRVGDNDFFLNVPNAFVFDATTGPNLASKITAVSTLLPSSVDNQPLVQIRIIATNAVGDDEWVGVDDIVIGEQEFIINSHTTSGQRDGAVAMDADGDALVVWESGGGQDGSGYGIFGQRFNAAGQKVGGEFRINTHTVVDQRWPAVAMDADGDAMVVWVSIAQDGNGFGIFGQRLDANGMKVGSEVQVNTYTQGRQDNPAVAMDAAGNAIVVWESPQLSYDIYAQRFDPAGMKVGGEFLVSTNSGIQEKDPAVAMDAFGNAVVIWHNNVSLEAGYDVFGQRLDSLGTKIGNEFKVNDQLGMLETRAEVAMDHDGDFIVTWQGTDGDGDDVFAQRFDSAGMKIGGELSVNSTTTGFQRYPAVAMDADGDAIITWQSPTAHGTGWSTFGQRFDRLGSKVGGEFQVNSVPASLYTSVALDSAGNAFVIWTGQDGVTNVGVLAQRFRSPNPPSRLTNIQINDGSPQRSLVTSLQVNFDNPLNFVGSPSSAFTLVNQKTTSPVTLAAVIEPGGKSVMLTFTGGSIDLGGSLADGSYTLTILGNQFTGNGFDGNGDGIPGDNYTMIGTPANGLFRLFGDADGNGGVSATDFNAFRLSYNTSGSSVFDFDNDGQVSAADFNQFRLRYGITIQP